MDAVYYLPEILFGCLVAAALVWGILAVRDIIRRSKGNVTCSYCKGAASSLSGRRYLFLLPISFGVKYEDPERYLPSHMEPIAAKEQIPTGRRACWAEIYVCSVCGRRQALITDFLQVRGKECVEGTCLLPYELVRHLTENYDTRYPL